MSDLTADIIRITSTALSPNSNEQERKAAHQQLSNMEQSVSPQNFLNSCNQILLDASYIQNASNDNNNKQVFFQVDACTSWIGNLLPRFIASGTIPAKEVQYHQMHRLLYQHLLAAANLNNDTENGGNNNDIQRLSSPLSKLHAISLSRVILACAKVLFPGDFSELFDPFFILGPPPPSKHSQKNQQQQNQQQQNTENPSRFKPILHQCFEAWQVVEFYIKNIIGIDELNPIPPHLVECEKQARAAVASQANNMVKVFFDAVESCGCGVDGVPLQVFESLFTIVEILIPHTSHEMLLDRPASLVVYGLRRGDRNDNKNANVDDDRAEMMANGCSSLFASLCASKGLITGSMREWMQQIIDAVSSLVAAQRWNAISTMIEGFEELPTESLQGVAPEVAALAGKILETQNLFFSHRFLPIFNRLLDSAQKSGIENIASILPENLVFNIFQLCPRNKSHPKFAHKYPTAKMSQEYFTNDEEYDQSFSEFRGQSSKTLRILAEVAPSVAAESLLKVLDQLSPPNYDNEDTNPKTGHVTQQSDIFFTWDACLFCTEHLSHCYGLSSNINNSNNNNNNNNSSNSNTDLLSAVQGRVNQFLAGPVQPVWDALGRKIGKNLGDAVLVPLYLNMIGAIFRAPDCPWPECVELLLHYAELSNNRVKQVWLDPDLIAARRRALTLLVRACTDYGSALVVHLDEVHKRITELNVRGSLMPSETIYLLEADTSLSCFLPDDQQAKFLDSIVRDPTTRLIRLGNDMNPEMLRRIIFSEGSGGSSGGGRSDEQKILTDDLGLVVAVSRRCSDTLYAKNLMQDLIGPASGILLALHQLQATCPPHLRAAFELSEEVSDAMSGARGGRFVPTAPNQNQQNNNNNSNQNQQQQQQQQLQEHELKRIRSFVAKLRTNLYTLLPIAMKIFGSVTENIATCLEGMQMASLPIFVAKAAIVDLFELAIELYPPCLPLCLRIIEPLFTEAKNRNNPHERPVYVSRQLNFIYRSLMGKIRKAVLVPGLYKTNRDICVSLVNFLSALVMNCPDVMVMVTSEAAQMIPEIPDDGVLSQFFCTLCRAIGTTGQSLAKKELDNCGNNVFGAYQKNFDRLSTLLKQELPSPLQELLDRFHGSLHTIHRFPQKREKFVEFCKQLCS